MNKNTYLMNEGWLFYKGEYVLESLKEASPTCYASKSESGRGPAAYAFNDETWEKVTVPHDYAVLGQPHEGANAAHGYLDRGPSWYRRYFDLFKEDEGKRIKLIFEGIATNCTVWVNGHLMKRHFTGYEDFEIDITELVYYGEATNVVAVRVDTELYGNPTEAFEGWWYDGAGIYRNVYLEKVPEAHVARYGVAIKTHEKMQSWGADIEVELVNEGFEKEELEITASIIDGEGVVVDTLVEKVVLDALSEGKVSFRSKENKVRLWSLEDPYLYTAKITLSSQQKTTQVVEERFGYRTIGLSVEEGFLLNGKPVKIKGTSNHQDHGALGAAVPDNVMRWRIKMLQEMGCNAYRCAHHTVAPALLDACDELGMLVMSENRWFTTEEENLQCVRRMVKREQNHPSIIMWSVGNEETLQCEKKGERIATKLIKTIKSIDDTRPCTLACNGGFFEKTAVAACDVIGMNYFPWLYDEVHKVYPDKVIMATEASCSNNCRGVYEEDGENNRFVAYDKHAPSFGSIHREAWKYVDERAFVAGIFYWTGFEYRGETRWPSLFAELGMIDSNGFKKDNFYLMQALWKEEPMIHILPHWNWQKGKAVEVWVYSNSEEVELFLNGKSLGAQKVNPYTQCQWFVDYEAGTLKAIGKRDGVVVCEEEVTTTGVAQKVKLELMNEEVKANGEDVAMIAVSVVDEEGRRVPDANNLVKLSFEGDCTYLGRGASPIDHTPVGGKEGQLYSGYMMVYVRLGREGKCTIKAEVEGLETGVLEMQIAPALGKNYIKPGKAELLIKKWWSTVVFDTRRTPENYRHRMPAEPGQPIPLFGVQTGYAMLSVATNLPSYTENKRISLYFGGITGRAEIWVRRRDYNGEGQLDAMKENAVVKKVENISGELYAPVPWEVYYHKVDAKEESVLLDLPRDLFTPDAPITIWVGIEGNEPTHGITGLVKWLILDDEATRGK